jgi:hypothetical protein
MLSTIDSHLRILIDSIENHIQTAILSVGSSHRGGRRVDPTHESELPVINNLKSTLSRQSAAARTTIQFLGSRLSAQMREYRSVLTDNLNRETQLRDRLKRLHDEAERHGIYSRAPSPQSEAEAPPISSHNSGTWTPADVAEFEADLRELVSLRDRLLEHVDPIDVLYELKHSS